MDTPSTAKPWFLYVFSNSMNQGISILQGPHHVAQKLSNTTLPLKSESRRGAPFASLRLKSGAAFRSSATLSSVRAWLGAEEQPTSSEVASAMAANGPPMADEDTLKTPPWDCSLGGAAELQRLRQGRAVPCLVSVAGRTSLRSSIRPFAHHSGFPRSHC